MAQAQKIYDSLYVLPLVRQEAKAWRRAYAAEQVVSTSTRQRLDATTELLNSKTAEYTTAQSKAHKRGLLNWLLTAALVGVTALAITH